MTMTVVCGSHYEDDAFADAHHDAVVDVGDGNGDVVMDGGNVGDVGEWCSSPWCDGGCGNWF